MSGSTRAAAVTLGVVASTVIAIASPGFASAAPSGRHHHVASTHHHAARLKQVKIDGLVMSVHQTHVAVFATSSTVGHRTSHNSVVHLTFRRHARTLRRLHRGYVVHLVSTGHGTLRRLVVPSTTHAAITPAPASVVVGEVRTASDGMLVVSQFSRDGRHAQGSQRHNLTVDTDAATVTVDGGAGQVVPGDLVAILGETQEDSVLASRVYAFSGELESLRGTIVAISGDQITVRGALGRKTVALGSGDSQLPLFVNGGTATTDQLQEGDRIVVLGIVTEEEEAFTPVAGFAFNGHDVGPCGANPEPSQHGTR